MLYLPERQAIKRLLEEKAVGDIFHVNWSEAWPLWPRIRDDRNSWHWQAERGGGMLGAVGSHMIDALQHWCGSFSNRQVFERKGEHGLEASNADDSFYVNRCFQNGGTFSLQFITAAIGRKPRIEIFGSNGTLVLEGNNLSLNKRVP